MIAEHAASPKKRGGSAAWGWVIGRFDCRRDLGRVVPMYGDIPREKQKTTRRKLYV